ncbi:MAG: ATP-binding cassette domain-containing protein [Alphaproteobacteria bacterium]|nr:ATP-binding cassette domain-containing protein [Alphaproteobacteria bacterium]
MSNVVVDNVWKEYETQVVLERISFETGEHAFVAIVGPSGCGKSTFLRLLMSEERASRGTITIDGEALPPEPTPERGIVFQRYSVFPHLTALQNVLVGLELRDGNFFGRLFGRRRRQARAAAAEMLDHVGLKDASSKYPAQLSGGMQQRLALAQALITKPKVLLLDEPFGALDPGTRKDIHALLLRLWRETQMTVLMVTHDLPEAFTLATRVIAFDRLRNRPEEKAAYGATITFDVDLEAERRWQTMVPQAPVAEAAP